MRSLGRLLKQVALMVLSLVVSFAVLRAGSSYIYCSVMDEVRTDECCKHAEADDTAYCALYAHHDCCAVQKLRTLPTVAVGATPGVPSPPLLAVQSAPAFPIVMLPTSRALGRSERLSTGPPRPSEISPRLQVFLI